MPAALFGAIESMIDAGHDPRRFAIDLLERFRDLIVLQAVPDAVARGVVDAPEDELEKMRSQASRIGTATLTRYAEVVHAGLGEMRGATAPRLLLEVVCARLLLPSASDTEAALLQRIERIETRMEISIPASEGGVATPAAAAGQAVRAQDAAVPSRRSHRRPSNPPRLNPNPSRYRPQPVPEPVTAPPDPEPVAVAPPGPESVPAAPEPEPVAVRPEPEPVCRPNPTSRRATAASRSRRPCRTPADRVDIARRASPMLRQYAACGRRCARRSASAAAPPR